MLIDEFRLSGPGGAADQYAELYNAGSPVSLAGFTLAASSGASVTVPATAPVLPTGGAYLITGGGYSLSAVAASDLSAASLGSDGLEVTAPDGLGTVTDAAGSAGAAVPLREPAAGADRDAGRPVCVGAAGGPRGAGQHRQ